jgi:Na+/melibiose symporter-like transporter
MLKLFVKLVARHKFAFGFQNDHSSARTRVLVYFHSCWRILSISVANSLLFIGASLEVIALLSLPNVLRPMTKKIYYTVAVLSIVGFQLILFLYNKESIRIAYCSFIIAFMIIPVYRLIWGKGRSLLMRMIGFYRSGASVPCQLREKGQPGILSVVRH